MIEDGENDGDALEEEKQETPINEDIVDDGEKSLKRKRTSEILFTVVGTTVNT